MPFRRRTFGLGAVSTYEEKNNEAGNFLNAVVCKPVETRVLNPNASEASYKPEQRGYRKTKLKKKLFLFCFVRILIGGILSGGFYPGTSVRGLTETLGALSVDFDTKRYFKLSKIS